MNSLYRKVVAKSEFDALMPESSCEKVRKSKGDTHTSIELMIEQIMKHNNQVSKIAPLLKGNSLQDTCNNIHSFLFNHFQYKADSSDQMLRSPACSWKQRFEGIDCKSYSIIASCLLINLDLKHYIRKIKQPTFNPDGFTHVYVIVPINQETGNLKQGYYTIDGTLQTTIEPTFIETKDFYMELQHYALNGPLNGSTFNWTTIKQKLFSNISISSILNIRCWGGTGFDTTVANNTVNVYNNYLTDKMVLLFKAIEAKQSDEALTALINEILVSATGLWANFNWKKGEGWNVCSRDNMEAVMQFADETGTNTLMKFKKWVLYYFDATQTPNKVYNAQVLAGKMGVSPCDNTDTNFAMPESTYKLKPNLTEFTPFEFTPYAINTPPSTFDVSQFLQTAENVIPLVFPTNDGGGNAGTGGSYSTDNGNTPTKSNNTGLYVVGFGALGYLAYRYFKNKNNKKQ